MTTTKKTTTDAEAYRKAFDKLLLDYGKEIEGKPECGLRDEGGAAHRCRCASCQGFKRLQLKIKALRRTNPPRVRIRKITRLR